MNRPAIFMGDECLISLISISGGCISPKNLCKINMIYLFCTCEIANKNSYLILYYDLPRNTFRL